MQGAEGGGGGHPGEGEEVGRDQDGDQGGEGGQVPHRAGEQGQKCGGERQEGPGTGNLGRGQEEDDGEWEPGAGGRPSWMSEPSQSNCRL